METFTQKEVEQRREIGKITGVPVRFFIVADIESDDPDNEGFGTDLVEVTEQEFIDHKGEIEYERHTVFANGVSQICLTKNATY